MWEFNGQYLGIVVAELITVDIHLDRRLALTPVFRPENVGDIGISSRMYDIGIISVLIWFPGKSEYPLTCGNPDSREPGYRFTSHSLIGRFVEEPLELDLGSSGFAVTNGIYRFIIPSPSQNKLTLSLHLLPKLPSANGKSELVK